MCLPLDTWGQHTRTLDFWFHDLGAIFTPLCTRNFRPSLCKIACWWDCISSRSEEIKTLVFFIYNIGCLVLLGVILPSLKSIVLRHCKGPEIPSVLFSLLRYNWIFCWISQRPAWWLRWVVRFLSHFEKKWYDWVNMNSEFPLKCSLIILKWPDISGNWVDWLKPRSRRIKINWHLLRLLYDYIHMYIYIYMELIMTKQLTNLSIAWSENHINSAKLAAGSARWGTPT